MNRRIFFKKGSLASLGLGLMSMRNIGSSPIDFAFNETSITALQEALKSGQLTSKKITSHYLQRIQAIDKKGPKLHAVIELNPDALNIAENLDQERKAGKIRGPLHGIPILLKDNINTGDKMQTTAGALALAGNKAASDAFITSKLREAGAIILGKTNLSEWANYRSTTSSSGWSGRGGQTKNPYVLTRTPSGSSSGSGAAVSANLCVVAVGTETNGSVIAPSSNCGIVGMKPTIGLVSRSGIIPISATQDTAGPMARNVTDAAILLGVLAGKDANDPVTKNAVAQDYTQFLKKDALKGKRIGIEKSFLQGAQIQTIAVFKEAIATMEKAGATIVEIELLKEFSSYGAASSIVLRYEFKEGVNQYLATSNATVRTLKDVIAFNKANGMPFFQQELLEMSEATTGLSTKEYTDAVAKSTSFGIVIDRIMRENQLDAIAATSYGPSVVTDIINGDKGSSFYFSAPAALAGYPHITVPMGQIHEMPVGLSFIASAFQEGALFGFAYAYEQASKKRREPKFLSAVDPMFL